MTEALRRTYEHLAVRERPALMRAAARLAGNEPDAEDLVQDALLAGWRFFDRFRPGTSFAAWIHTILRNTFYNRVRRRRLEPAAMSTEDLAASAPTRLDLDPAESSAQRALENVPEPFRQVVAMADLGDYKYREIARELGIPVGTVMSRLFRGRRALEDLLQRREAAESRA